MPHNCFSPPEMLGNFLTQYTKMLINFFNTDPSLLMSFHLSTCCQISLNCHLSQVHYWSTHLPGLILIAVVFCYIYKGNIF